MPGAAGDPRYHRRNYQLILALICVTQPFNPLRAVYLPVPLALGVALIVRRMPGRFSALMLIVLSLVISLPLYLVALHTLR